MGGAGNAALHFFPKHYQNGDSLKHKFYNIANRGPPTGAPDCSAYARYAKAIKSKIINDIDGSTGSGVAESLENFDSEFADAEDNSDKDDENHGIDPKNITFKFSFDSPLKND